MMKFGFVITDKRFKELSAQCYHFLFGDHFIHLFKGPAEAAGRGQLAVLAGRAARGRPTAEDSPPITVPASRNESQPAAFRIALTIYV